MYYKRTVIGVLLKYCRLNHKAAKKERKKETNGKKGLSNTVKCIARELL